jgi:prevent-host-death family protein
MTRLNIAKARDQFPEIVTRAAKSGVRTIVSSGGKDLAAVVPIKDLRLLNRMSDEEIDRRDLKDARASLAEARKKGTVPLSKAKKVLGLI